MLFYIITIRLQKVYFFTYIVVQELYQRNIYAKLAVELAVQEFDDGIGVRAREAVSQDGDTAVSLDGHVAEDESGTAGNGTDRRETDGRFVIADQFFLTVRYHLCVLVNDELIREHDVAACHSAS